MKQCDKCDKFPRVGGTKFCGRCADLTRKEMKSSGYLTHVPGFRPRKVAT